MYEGTWCQICIKQNEEPQPALLPSLPSTHRRTPALPPAPLLCSATITALQFRMYFCTFMSPARSLPRPARNVLVQRLRTKTIASVDV